MPEPPGQRIELIGGEVITMGRGGIPHETVKKNLNRLLVLWLSINPIAEVWAETMYQLDEHTSPIPDLSVLFPGRVPPGAKGWIQGAPEIAIEVVSSESAALLQRKIDFYLAHGGKSVWVVFPQQHMVMVHRSSEVRRFDHDDTLEDPTLPGFQTSVASLFEGI